MSNLILSSEQDRDQRFEDLIKGLKCPYRIRTHTDLNGDTLQYMMPCDPQCAALINRADKSAFSCIRLMNIQYPLKYEHGIEIFHGIDKEED